MAFEKVKGYPSYEIDGFVVRNTDNKKLVPAKKGILKLLDGEGKEHEVKLSDIATAKPAANGDKKEATPAATKGKKEKKVKEKKPGVIATIFEFIKAANKPGASKPEILDHLKKTFKDKSADSMKNTINAQLGSKQPTRMEQEKEVKFEIISKEGEDNRYYMPKR